MRSVKKKLGALALSAALVGTSLPLSAAAASFRDVVPGSWYSRAVYDLADQGILNGTSATTFSPEASLTRGAFITMLARTALTAGELSQYGTKGNFKDVSTGHWANQAVNWGVEAGVIHGMGDGTFKPDQAVSRQDMAVMVTNFAKAMGYEMPTDEGGGSFSDASSIASYAKASVTACQKAGVIDGYEDGSFRPNASASRAEAAVLYQRFLDNCPEGDFQILRKRVRNVAVRGVEFEPYELTAGLALGGDRVTGGESPGSLVKRTGARIAVNAAFFNMDSYLPIGTLIDEGRVLTSDNTYAPAKSAFVMDSVGNFSIQNFSTNTTATLYKADGSTSVAEQVVVNRQPSSPSDGARILFTRDWGKSLGFTARYAVAFDQDGTILQVGENQDMAIPEDGYVLAQRGQRPFETDFFPSCQKGLTIWIDQSYQGAAREDIQLSIGAGPRIVKDGAVYGNASTYAAEGFSGFASGTAVRVAAGIKEDGSLVLVVANTTLSTLSQILVDLGCEDAINFDGGGSTNLYVDGQWLYGPQERLLNTLLYFK